MQEYDLVVVGSGAAGMTAALTAAHHGLEPLLVEKATRYGGSTARSTGAIWIPGNQELADSGVKDTPDDGRRYLAHIVGDSSPEPLQRAFIRHGPAMLSLIQKHTPLYFNWVPRYSDHYPEAPGAVAAGRAVEPQPLAADLLGEERERLRPPYRNAGTGLAVTQAEYRWLNLAARHPLGLWRLLQARLRRYEAAWKKERELLTMGQALVAGLRVGLADAGVPLWLDSPLVNLVQDGRQITGVTVLREGKPVTVRARYGVVLASGGFEHHEQLRTEHQREPVGTEWTIGVPENTGDGIVAGIEAGAATAVMDDAWWGPAIELPDGPYFCLAERALPGCLMVNRDGVRFVNEAAPSVDTVHAMYGPGAGWPTDPSGGPAQNMPTWLIFDERYRSRYPFAGLAANEPIPSEWYSYDVVRRAASLPALADRIGVAADVLCATVDRFNAFAGTGTDEDFSRGGGAYDRYFGDPRNAPNPCLGAVSHAPFYAVRLVPGDLGTKGGLCTDTSARVLRPDGTSIDGLYATGNTAAPVMGRTYAGPGATIGPAMTFGYVAALHIAARDATPQADIVVLDVEENSGDTAQAPRVDVMPAAESPR
ncbi:MAG: 3-oxosteroid 1-dehydrogenase [Micromonosporaceae bacterium]